MSTDTRSAVPTPTPWRVTECLANDDGEPTFYIEPSISGDALCGERGRANAAHIVACVNAHDELVEALQAMLDTSQPPALQAQGIARQPSRAALALARAALAKVSA